MPADVKGRVTRPFRLALCFFRDFGTALGSAERGCVNSNEGFKGGVMNVKISLVLALVLVSAVSLNAGGHKKSGPRGPCWRKWKRFPVERKRKA